MGFMSGAILTGAAILGIYCGIIFFEEAHWLTPQDYTKEHTPKR